MSWKRRSHRQAKESCSRVYQCKREKKKECIKMFVNSRKRGSDSMGMNSSGQPRATVLRGWGRHTGNNTYIALTRLRATFWRSWASTVLLGSQFNMHNQRVSVVIVWFLLHEVCEISPFFVISAFWLWNNPHNYSILPQIFWEILWFVHSFCKFKILEL